MRQNLAGQSTPVLADKRSLCLYLLDSVAQLSGVTSRRLLPTLRGRTVADVRNAAVDLAADDNSVANILTNAVKDQQRNRTIRAQSKKEYMVNYVREARSHTAQLQNGQPATSSDFLMTSPDSVKKRQLQAFIESTSSRRLAKVCCAVCARLMTSEMVSMSLSARLSTSIFLHRLIHILI